MNILRRILKKSLLALALSAIMILIWQMAQAEDLPQKTCYILLAKNNCWKNHSVDLEVLDASVLEPIGHIKLSEDSDYTLQKIDCTKLDKITFKASYSPTVWESEKGKQYGVKHIWPVPSATERKKENWMVKLCFSNDFVRVPMPLVDDPLNCRCTFPADLEKLL